MLDSRAELRIAPDVFEKLFDPGIAAPEHVMGGEAPTGGDLRLQVAKILEIPLLVSVTEDEIEGACEGRHQIVGIADRGLRGPEVGRQ
jgi:hypothetical protein